MRLWRSLSSCILLCLSVCLSVCLSENGFGAFWARKNASDDNEFGISIRPIDINFINVWCYIIHSERDKIGIGFGIRDNWTSRETSSIFPVYRPSKFGTVPVKPGRMVTLIMFIISITGRLVIMMVIHHYLPRRYCIVAKDRKLCSSLAVY